VLITKFTGGWLASNIDRKLKNGQADGRKGEISSKTKKKKNTGKEVGKQGRPPSVFREGELSNESLCRGKKRGGMEKNLLGVVQLDQHLRRLQKKVQKGAK